MTGLLGDLRYGIRGLVKNRGFVLVAATSLALGIGANTTIFTLLNALFLRPMPVRDAGSVASVVTVDSRTPGQTGVSFPNYLDLRDHNGAFSGLLLYTASLATLTGRGDPQFLMVHLVSGNYFQVLGLQLPAGRSFLPDEDAAPGAGAVAVITHALWDRLYGGDPGVTQQSIELNGRPYRIVGVAPNGFSGLNQLAGADVFVPVSMFGQIYPAPGMVNNRRAAIFAAAGRLNPGMSFSQARAAVEAAAKDLERQYPNENRGKNLRLVPVRQAAMNEQTRPVVSKSGAVLMVISSLVLLIACANVANLLLARASGRSREIAVRLALGAGRARLIRQLLAESILLSLLGGCGGLLVARLARDFLWSMRPPAFKYAGFSPTLDTHVLAFTLGMSLLTGLVFGLAPAIRASRPNLASDLKERGSTSGGIHRVGALRSILVIVQVALSLVALTGAGLFLRSLDNASKIDMGFDAAHLGIISYNLTTQGYNEARGRDYHQRAIETAAAVPGVAAVSIGRDLPFHVSSVRTLLLDGQEGRPMLASVVYPGYFNSMRMPLTRGRDFTPTDTKSTPRVVIVNQMAAAALWPGEDPIGKRISFAGEGVPVEVVGVARNANYRGIGEAATPLVYLSMVQYYFPTGVLYVRAGGDPGPVVASVRRAIQSLDRNLLLQAEPLEVSIRDILWIQRLSAGLLAVFGSLALILSIIGIYGVISYSVRQRTREIGLRLALGATVAEVRLQILREGIRLVAIGVVAGTAIATPASQTVGSLLLMRQPLDLVTFVAVPAILCLAGLAACWEPARRATLVDPAEALRYE